VARSVVLTIQRIVVPLIIALAAILGGTTVASAHPGHTGHGDDQVFTQYDENDQSWLTDRFEATLREMMQRYPEVTAIYLKTDVITEPAALAGAGMNYYGDPLIVIQERFAENPDAFVEATLEAVAAGFHPGGCDPVRLIAVHEFAHVLAYVHGDVAQEQIIAETAGGDFANGLHDYGEANVDEALATSFAAVVCGSQTPMEQQIYDILVSS
jgi:hypothetical protein